MSGTIKISADDLLELINQLRSRLNSAQQKYDSLRFDKERYTVMMGSGDSTAASMVAMIDSELAAIRKMIEVLEAAIIMLQEVLKSLSTYVEEATGTMQTAAGSVESAISKGVSAAKLG